LNTTTMRCQLPSCVLKIGLQSAGHSPAMIPSSVPFTLSLSLSAPLSSLWTSLRTPRTLATPQHQPRRLRMTAPATPCLAGTPPSTLPPHRAAISTPCTTNLAWAPERRLDLVRPRLLLAAKAAIPPPCSQHPWRCLRARCKRTSRCASRRPLTCFLRGMLSSSVLCRPHR
jgi:hypothetical protein